MGKNEFPAEVRRFVLASIPSVPHLEALMLLRTTAPKCWCADSLARRLYVTQHAAAAVLADLSQAGMLRPGPTEASYFYPAVADQLSATIDRLAALYASRLVELTLLIHSRRDRSAE